MMKKAVALAAAGVLMGTMAVGCSRQGEPVDNLGAKQEETRGGNQGEVPEAKKEREEMHYSVVWNTGKGRVVDRSNGPSMYDQFMKENFNMTFEWIDVPSTNFAEKMNLLFATNEYPDWIYRANKADLDLWAKDGYLYDYSQDWDRVSNYKTFFDDKEWENLLKIAKSPGGGIHFLPATDSKVDGLRPVNMGWNYRKSAFDRLGLEFPETIEDLHDALRVIKQNDPSSIPIPGRWELTGIQYGFTNAYRTSDDWYLDPDTEEVTYGPSTDKYREMLITLNQFYREKLIDQEFLTKTDDQWKQDVANGRGYIQFGAMWYILFNQLQEGSGEEWTWAPSLVRAYEDKGPVYTKMSGTSMWGPVITDKCEGEKLERLLEYLNWTGTREGMDMHLYGIEGETYEVDTEGNRVLMPHIKSNDHPEGTELVTYGFQYMAVNEYQPKDLKESTWIQGLTKAFSGKVTEGYTPLQGIVYTYLDEELGDVADKGTAIKDTRDIHVTKFIVGDMDPTNDQQWNQYIEALNKAGLSKLTEIRRAASARE